MVDVPVPDTIPFDTCVPAGRITHCFSAHTPMVVPHRRECNPETTPLLDGSTALTYTEKDSDTDEEKTELEMWVGVENATSFSAIWIGVDGGECTQIRLYDPPSPTATIDDIVDWLSDKQDAIGDAISDVHWETPSAGEVALSIFVAIVMIIYAILKSPFGGIGA